MKKTAERADRPRIQDPLVPPVIAEGATIGLVAPAGPLVNRENFAAGIAVLEKKGFRVKYGRKLLRARGYLAGTDEERAADFNRLWRDPEVAGLVAARGGYGCLRLLDLIDMKQVRKNPKPLIGFSDLTVLLAAINRKTGLVAYHGPVVTTLADIDRKSLASFFSTLTTGIPASITPASLKVLRGGRTKGILLGGNLTTLVHMLATPYEIPWDRAILFLEDIGESPYRLDRLLTHLARAGRLQKVKGLILGSFSDENRRGNSAMQRTVRNRALELLAGRDIPVWANFPVGHGRRNLTLPVGLEAEMDADGAALHFLPPSPSAQQRVRKS